MQEHERKYVRPAMFQEIYSRIQVNIIIRVRHTHFLSYTYINVIVL